jgi:TolB-like protein
MTPERYQQIDQIFQAALAQDPARRAAFLDEVCSDDEPLRKEVESLITSDEGGLSFINEPAFEMAARVLASDEPALSAGDHIDRYEVVSLLGSGGMGEVYLVHDEKLDRKIALKLLPSHFTTNQERLRRFQQEARATSALNHPNIITIHEIGQVDDRHFIATEYVEGETLRQRMRRGRLSMDEALDIAIQVCGALAAAHKAGIVHRDIKPENIMLRQDGYVKVLDFGLAKLTDQGERIAPVNATDTVDVSSALIMGTVKYMSPEQAQGLSVDPRSDLFSIGTVLYEMVTGKAPFVGDTNRDLIKAVLEDEPLLLEEHSLEIPSGLRSILSKTFRKDREERYQTAEELLLDLKKLTQHQTAHAQSFLRQKAGLFAALVVVATLVVVGLQFARNSRTRVNVAPARKSIAVLPFKSISGDSADEYLRQGIAEAIITKLTGVRELVVRPLASVAKYGARDLDPITVGKQLGVDVVLDGQIQRIGDQYRVTVQLWQVTDGASLSSYTCDDTCAKIFELEDSISQRAVNALAIRLTNQEQEYLAKRYTESKEAYDLYLRGRYFFDQNVPEGYANSVEFFNQAIKLDPNYAPAYAGLSDAYNQMAWEDPRTSIDLMKKSKAAANTALQIDDDLAEVHVSVATVKLMYDWDWPGAQAEYERAIALKPNYALAWNKYSYGLAFVGQFDKAIETSKVELALDPLSVTANVDLGIIYVYTRHPDEAIRQLQKVIEMDPKLPVAHLFLVYAYFEKGMYDDVVREVLTMRAARGANPQEIAALRKAYAENGWYGFEKLELEMALKEAQKGTGFSFTTAAHYALVGDNDKAMEWLEKTYQEHGKDMMLIRVDPRLDGLRSDPRFKGMLERVGLPQ